MTATELTDLAYRQQCNEILAAIESRVDGWLQDEVIDIDSSRNGGMLELTFPDRSKIVINMQPPLQELWLAAKGGGFHFKWQDGAWRDTKDGAEFLATLSRHASAQAGQPLSF